MVEKVTSAVVGDVVKVTVPVLNVLAPTLAVLVNTASPREPMKAPTMTRITARISIRFSIDYS
jgi:hypothetical protein